MEALESSQKLEMNPKPMLKTESLQQQASPEQDTSAVNAVRHTEMTKNVYAGHAEVCYDTPTWSPFGSRKSPTKGLKARTFATNTYFQCIQHL